jgi:hypothetical protein
MARAIQEGKMKAKAGTPSAEMAKMAPASLEHFATTKEAGLPKHKKKLVPMGYKRKLRREQDKSGNELMYVKP